MRSTGFLVYLYTLRVSTHCPGESLMYPIQSVLRSLDQKAVGNSSHSLSMTPIPRRPMASVLLEARAGENLMLLAWRTPRETVTMTLDAVYSEPS